MTRAVTLLAIGTLLLPSFVSGATCLERNEECSLGELMDISAKAEQVGITQQEHIAVLLEIITHLRRIITTFQATKQISYCVNLEHDLRPGATDAKTDGEVSTLQFFLTSQRIYGGLVTGYYGPQTAQGVYEWQRQQNIEGVTTDTGVGPVTRAKIKAETCAVVE